MHLITMAHLGEAQSIIEKYDLKRENNQLFKNDDLLLLITGEGPFEAATNTALCLGQHPVKKVLNLGIAGAIDSKLKIGEIYSIRTHYLFQEKTPAYKSFTHAGEYDCITSFERIMRPEKAQVLKGLGHIVDREAWGVAFAAKQAGVPFQSYKLISDMAGTIGACELIKEEALTWSTKLADFLNNILEVKDADTSSGIKLEGFHLTFSMQHRLQNLLTKIAIKEETSQEELIKRLPLLQWQEMTIAPKERTRLLLEYLEHKLDPTKVVLETKKNEWLRPFHKVGVNVSTDQEWEKHDVTISFIVKNDEELKSKSHELLNLSLRPFHDLLEGKLDVE